jgi:hypothetical protein
MTNQVQLQQIATNLAGAGFPVFPMMQRDKQDENPASIKMRTRGWRIVGRA